MKKLYACFSLCLFASILFAQTHERVITGQLKSTDDGSPLPGVNISIKGTTRGTVTDSEGKYSLSVPIGSVLVFSFIGMETREILVTETALQPAKNNFAIRMKSDRQRRVVSILQDTINLPGVAILKDNTPSYKTQSYPLNPADIVSVRKLLLNRVIFKANKNKFLIITNTDRYQLSGVKVQYSHGLSFEFAGKLPALQSSFAQGRNSNGLTVWRGPDQVETMSWGPLVKTLEYTGNYYPYDRNGAIAQVGSGNGQRVNTYNPYDFFKAAVTNSDELSIWFPGISRSTSNINFSRKSNDGVIPNNRLSSENFSLSMKRMDILPRLKADVSVLLNFSEGNFLNRGSNINNLIGSLMMTAPTFDLTNGFGHRAATANPFSYLLPNGQIRSAAPGVIDNPYGLINQSPDHEKKQMETSSLGLTYEHSKLKLNLNGSVNFQTNNIVNGIFPGYTGFVSGRRTERQEERKDAALNLLLSYAFRNYDKSWTLSFGYHYHQERRSVSRMDGFGYSSDLYNLVSTADSLVRFNFSKVRNINEVVTRAEFESNPLKMQFSNRTYFSNTSSASPVNFFPTVAFQVDLRNLVYIEFLNELRPFLSAGRSIREAPLLFGNNSSLSTHLSPEHYNKYFENQELNWRSQLKPETEFKFDAGVSAQTFSNLRVDFSYYNNTTFGMIMPVWNAGQFLLQNMATVNNRGTNGSISYSPWSYYDNIQWGIALRWTKYTTEVKELDGNDLIVPLAGFGSIQTAASKGKPLGAIYGSIFLRDDHGQRIIGADGFPIVKPQLSYLGSPIPKYIVSLEPYLSVKKRWKIGVLIDFKKGGQVWNGTKAALDYMGRSLQTAELRNISNYVFDGVTANGLINTMPVDFNNPSLDMQQNRWVRYGFSGVGEEHIEDASWIRFNEASLSYKFFPQWAGARKELTISFVGKNLWLFTPYSGVDPGTALYGYSLGNGLDLFNAPSLRSYSFLVTLKL